MTSGAYRVDPAAMTNSEIGTSLDALYRAQLKLQDALIRLGRGMEKPQMHGRGDDDVDILWRENAYRIEELENVLRTRSAWKYRKPTGCGTATETKSA